MGNPYAPPGENQRPPEPPRTAPEGADASGRGRDGAGQPGAGSARPGPQHPSPPQGWPPPGAEQGGPPQGSRPQVGREPHRPAPPAPDSEIVRTTSRRVLHFLAFLLASVVTSALPLPWQAASLVFVAVGIVVGLRALVLAWRGGVRGGLAATLSVGVALACFVGLGMVSLLAFWPQQLDRQECLAGAVTISANRTCEADFRRAVDERLGRTEPAATGLSASPGVDV